MAPPPSPPPRRPARRHLACPTDLVGQTPLVEVDHLSPRPGVRIALKLEGANPTGSIKDRVARAIIVDAEARGALEPGQVLVEATSGNTGIALALIARQRGYGLELVLPRGVAPSVIDVLELLEVPIHWADPRAGMRSAIELAEELAAKHGWFPVRQFSNPVNIEVHYRATGREILEQAGEVDVFVAGTGTGGTLMGVGRRLKEANPDCRIVAVEPRLGERLQGLRSLEEGFVPPLLDLSALDRRVLVDTPSSLQWMQRVARHEGLVVGVSTGACLWAAMREAERMERGTIVVMSADSGWKYLPSHPWEAAHQLDARLDDIHWW